MGRLFQLFPGRGGDFLELGHCPLFGLLWLASELSWSMGVSFSMLMYYSECIMRLKVYWKSNLLPSWTQLVLTSFCHVSWLCHSFFFFKIYLFIIYLFIYLIYFWLRRVLVVAHGIFVEACGIFRCGTWALRCGAQASL